MGCTQPAPAPLSPLKLAEVQTHSGLKLALVPDQLVVHEARALIYTCMDFRLLDDIVMFMNEKGYTKNYDQFILAGCSLAFVKHIYKPWRVTARQHLDLAIQLHKIKEVICIEHEQCGAYKLHYPEMNPKEEKQYHIRNVIELEKKIKKSHPELELHAYYMHLTGISERIN